MRCGGLIVGGFEGTELPRSYRQSLARGERAGAILFSRNVADLDQVAALNASIVEALEDALVAVDQEGGRVARLREAPFLVLPAMRVLGEIDDVALTERAAETLGASLAALGFNLDFAPVFDVDSNPENPVIGDRSFGRSPAGVTRHGLAFVRGLQRHLHACAKHFPGHGDTDRDSHFALPVVSRARESLIEVELAPFIAAAEGGVAAMMSAHVVYTALDAERPATLASMIATTLLREEIGYGGVLFSDDLLMAAVAERAEPGAVAVEAVAAGCDLLLVCRDEDRQEAVLEGLSREDEASPAFRARVDEALGRGAKLRSRRGRVASLAARREALARGRALEAEIAGRIDGQSEVERG